MAANFYKPKYQKIEKNLTETVTKSRLNMPTENTRDIEKLAGLEYADRRKVKNNAN